VNFVTENTDESSYNAGTVVKAENYQMSDQNAMSAHDVLSGLIKILKCCGHL
jgi:hypothetical protein